MSVYYNIILNRTRHTHRYTITTNGLYLFITISLPIYLIHIIISFYTPKQHVQLAADAAHDDMPAVHIMFVRKCLYTDK